MRERVAGFLRPRAQGRRLQGAVLHTRWGSSGLAGSSEGTHHRGPHPPALSSVGQLASRRPETPGFIPEGAAGRHMRPSSTSPEGGACFPGPTGLAVRHQRSACRLRWSPVGRAAPRVTEPGARRVTASVQGSAEAGESSGRPGDREKPQRKAGLARHPRAAGGAGPPRHRHRDKGTRLLLCEKEFLLNAAAVCQKNSLGGLSGMGPQSRHGENSCFRCENLDENFIVISPSDACARLREELETG